MSILDVYLVYICQLRCSSNITLYCISEYEAVGPPLTSNVKLDLSFTVIAVRPLCVYVCVSVCVCVLMGVGGVL